MSTPCTNCQYLAYSCVCVKIQLIFPFFQNVKEEENHGYETKLEKNLDQEFWVF